MVGKGWGKRVRLCVYVLGAVAEQRRGRTGSRVRRAESARRPRLFVSPRGFDLASPHGRPAPPGQRSQQRQSGRVTGPRSRVAQADSACARAKVAFFSGKNGFARDPLATTRSLGGWRAAPASQPRSRQRRCKCGRRSGAPARPPGANAGTTRGGPCLTPNRSARATAVPRRPARGPSASPTPARGTHAHAPQAGRQNARRAPPRANQFTTPNQQKLTESRAAAAMAAAVLPAFSTNLGTAATATLLGGWEGAVRVGLGGRGWGLAFTARLSVRVSGRHPRIATSSPPHSPARGRRGDAAGLEGGRHWGG